MMKKIIILLICWLSTFFVFANDGVFYASGNQLIPITETDISVKKEVLTINMVGDHLEVTVYYEFFNPKGEKDLLVGFEAMAPYNSRYNLMDFYPKHPHINNFKVTMNGEPLSFEIAHVELGSYDNNGTYVPSKYYVNGEIQSWTRQQIEDTLAFWDYPDFPVDYVYHFKAHFRQGLNIIQHTYYFDLSFSVEEVFSFPYVLTAANRWANGQIDDFLLLINLGNHESFHIAPEFFKTIDEWTIIGKGKASIDTTWGYITADDKCPVFHIQEGGLSFRKANFHPEGELNISQRRLWSYLSWGWENDEEGAKALIEVVKEQYQPLCAQELSENPEDYSSLSPEQRRIMKNLPFAYRGYIFKTKSLQDFFESTNWYIPNPDYHGDMEAMSPEEKKWINYWSEEK